MKKFTLGIIIGALLCTVFPVKAAIEEYILYRADYKVVVNGTEYSDPELPILSYKGNTYVPMRSIGDLLGAKVSWNAELGQAEINKIAKQPISTPATDNESTTDSIQTLKIGETWDNGNAKITIYDFEKKPANDYLLKTRPKATEEIRFKLKIELDENTIMQHTLYSGYYVTDNEKYNTPKGRIPILTTGRIDYGETRIHSLSQYNQDNYTIKKVVLSFPSLAINNLTWEIAD